MTVKLYYSDGYLQHFTASTMKTTPQPKGLFGVVLDRTAFYPEGGGQPSDKGFLGSSPVLDVQEQNGEIVHILASPPDDKVLVGHINWECRFDHMQQHTGQHLLSAACDRLFGSGTVGFHMGAESSQIDIEMQDFSAEQCRQAEKLVNEWIINSQPVKVAEATLETIHQFPLRKKPAKNFDRIRLITIEGIDCCPCGGTHVKTTGEIGLVKIRHWERKNGLIRLDFVCGWRALRDYQQKTNLANALCSRLSVPHKDILSALEKQFLKVDQAAKQLITAKRELYSLLAKDLYNQAETVAEKKIITHVLPDSSPADVAELAKQLAQYPSTVALLAGINPEHTKAHLVFACSPELTLNMGSIIKTALPLIEGKGGGGGSFAQGGGAVVNDLNKALQAGQDELLRLL